MTIVPSNIPDYLQFLKELKRPVRAEIANSIDTAGERRRWGAGTPNQSEAIEAAKVYLADARGLREATQRSLREAAWSVANSVKLSNTDLRNQQVSLSAVNRVR